VETNLSDSTSTVKKKHHVFFTQDWKEGRREVGNEREKRFEKGEKKREKTRKKENNNNTNIK